MWLLSGDLELDVGGEIGQSDAGVQITCDRHQKRVVLWIEKIKVTLLTGFACKKTLWQRFLMFVFNVDRHRLKRCHPTVRGCDYLLLRCKGPDKPNQRQRTKTADVFKPERKQRLPSISHTTLAQKDSLYSHFKIKNIWKLWMIRWNEVENETIP